MGISEELFLFLLGNPKINAYLCRMKEIKQLEQKIKATILLVNGLGMPILRHVWLTGYGTEKSAWGGKDKVIAYFTYKGKRKRTGLKFDKAIIGEGWQDIKGCFNTSDGEFTCFEDSQFKTLAEKVEKVIISTENQEKAL